jgi:hypothetical protein
MNTSGEARTRRAQTGGGRLTRPATGHGTRRFLRHYLAMFALMFLVMLRRRAEYGGASHG